VPPVAPEARDALVAAETVLSTGGDRDVVGDGATAVLTTPATSDDRPHRPARRPDRPARPSEPMVDTAVAPRAPPRA